MNDMQKLGKVEAMGLNLAVISNNIIFNMTSVIFNSCGSGSWLNVLYVSILSILFMLVAIFLFKRFISYDILDVSEYLGGSWLKGIMAILFIVLFMSFSAVSLRYYVNDLHVIYYPEYNYLVLLLITFIPVIISSKIGLKAIYGTNLVVIPIAVLSIVLLFSISIRDFTWQRLFPAFGYGVKNTFVTQSLNVFAFNVIAYLYFLPPFLKDTKDFKKVTLFSVISCALYFILTTLALTMTFAYSFTADEALSLYLIARFATLGRFFQRIDAIFIFIWLLAFLSFVSLNVYLISYIIKKSFKLSNFKEIIGSVSLVMLGFTLFFKNISTVGSFTKNFFKPYSVLLIFVVSFLILIFANFKKRRDKKWE